MKLRYLPLVSALLLSLPAFSFAASEEMYNDIAKLLDMTGTRANSTQMANAISQQMIAGLRQSNPGFTAEAANITSQAVSEFMAKFMNDKETTNALVDVYAKNFTPDEIKGLISFYSSPLGKKISSSLPQLTAESAQALQQLFMKQVPALQEEVKNRLEATVTK